MDTKVNYFIVGLFMTVLTLAIIGAAVWLAGGQSTANYRTYLTYINESVAGLTPKSPVKFNGVEVGNVKDIALNPYNPQQVRLELDIDEKTPITESTRATLQTQGITGIMFVALKAEEIMSPPLRKIPSEPYPVIKSSPSLYLRVDQALQSISESVKDVFNEENKSALKKVLHNLEVTTNAIAVNSKTIDDTLKSFPEIVKSLDKALANASSAADQLNHTSAEGKRTLKDISDQTLPATQQVLLRLKDTMTNIEQLSDELVKNPAVIIRGKPTAPPGPGEK